MGVSWSIVMGQTTLVTGACILALVLGFATHGFVTRSADDKRRKIPAVGVGSGPLAAHIASRRSLEHARAWISEGYHKYKSGVFKVRAFQEWMILISGPELIEELRRAPDDMLSFREAASDGLQWDYTLGDWRTESQLHIGLIKGKLTRSLASLFPEVIDEIDAAYSDEITANLNGNEWTTLPIMEPLMRVVCRASNRVFVGLPLCRNPEYIDLNVEYSVATVTSSNTLKQFPDFLKPFVGRFLTPIPQTYARAERVMTSFLEVRRRETEKHGKGWDDDDKPDDFLQWVLDAAEEREKVVNSLMKRILRLNFAAIHTTASSFAFALFHVAAEPEKYQAPIRQEVHDALSQHGWTKTALDKLHRVDSLLREALRFHGLGAITMSRKAMQEFTFSDGTHIKKGEIVSVASRATHRDGAIYDDAETFDGFRFYKEHENEDDASPHNGLVATSFEYLPFGMGRHACPGRFWAANEMKAMLAYMVTHYDMRMEREGVVPDEAWLGTGVSPDRNARVVFRKREAPVY